MAAREYHWVMTAKTQLPNGAFSFTTSSGVVLWDGDRSGAYNAAAGKLAKRLNCTPDDLNVLFWSFEPNDLA
jgi:hypothetical protein